MKRTQIPVAGFEDRGKGPGTKENRQLLDADRGKEAYYSSEPPETNATWPAP